MPAPPQWSNPLDRALPAQPPPPQQQQPARDLLTKLPTPLTHALPARPSTGGVAPSRKPLQARMSGGSGLPPPHAQPPPMRILGHASNPAPQAPMRILGHAGSLPASSLLPGAGAPRDRDAGPGPRREHHEFRAGHEHRDDGPRPHAHDRERHLRDPMDQDHYVPGPDGPSFRDRGRDERERRDDRRNDRRDDRRERDSHHWAQDPREREREGRERHYRDDRGREWERERDREFDARHNRSRSPARYGPRYGFEQRYEPQPPPPLVRDSRDRDGGREWERDRERRYDDRDRYRDDAPYGARRRERSREDRVRRRRSPTLPLTPKVEEGEIEEGEERPATPPRSPPPPPPPPDHAPPEETSPPPPPPSAPPEVPPSPPGDRPATPEGRPPPPPPPEPRDQPPPPPGPPPSVGRPPVPKSPGPRSPVKNHIARNAAFAPRREGSGAHAPNRNLLEPATRVSTPVPQRSATPTPHGPKLFRFPTVAEEKETYSRHFVGTSTLAAYDIGAKLGEGTFGVVTKAVELATKQAVALKKLITHNPRDGVSVTTVREIKILKELHHPNIVPLLDMVVERKVPADRSYRGEVFMVFPYMDHDLCGLLLNKDFRMTHSVAKLLLKQILDGLSYMHANNIIHRDLKTANILVSKEGQAMIADFGLARTLGVEKMPKHSPHEYTNMVVTRWYRAPELLLGDQRYTTAIDLWSVGCILGEMYVRDPIFPGSSDKDQLHKIFSRVGPPNHHSWPTWRRLPGFPEAVDHPWDQTPRETTILQCARKWQMDRTGADLLVQLLNIDPAKRPTADQALEHVWFWTDPMPAKLGSIPVVESSHEMTSREREPAPAPPAHRALPQQGRAPPPTWSTGGPPRPNMPPHARPPPGGRPGYGGGGGGGGGGGPHRAPMHQGPGPGHGPGGHGGLPPRPGGFQQQPYPPQGGYQGNHQQGGYPPHGRGGPPQPPFRLQGGPGGPGPGGGPGRPPGPPGGMPFKLQGGMQVMGGPSFGGPGLGPGPGGPGGSGGPGGGVGGGPPWMGMKRPDDSWRGPDKRPRREEHLPY